MTKICMYKRKKDSMASIDLLTFEKTSRVVNFYIKLIIDNNAKITQ